MSINNGPPRNTSSWGIRLSDITGNNGQKIIIESDGSMIIGTGDTDRLTINSSGAWTCQGGMSYNNATNALTVGTLSGAATNLSGGLGGQIPYQSATSTTALLANGTAGQFLISNGGTSAPSWSTPTVTTGNFQFDDMWGCGAGNNGPFGMNSVGTHAASSPQSVLTANDGYNGITRILNSAANTSAAITSAGWQSGSPTIFGNLLENGLGFTMIFRPWPAGSTGFTTIYCGFSSNFSDGAPPNQLAWQYSTNQSPTGVWNFRENGGPASGGTATGLAQGANEWFKITLVRTGNLGYTTTIQNLTTPSPIYSYSGSVSPTTNILYMGGFVSCTTNGTSKYLDIDYISCEFNSTH